MSLARLLVACVTLVALVAVIGVDLVADRTTRTAATTAAAFVKNALRGRHILLGTEGPDDNVLKIRPPMTFDAAAADRLLEELDCALADADSVSSGAY